MMYSSSSIYNADNMSVSSLTAHKAHLSPPPITLRSTSSVPPAIHGSVSLPSGDGARDGCVTHAEENARADAARDSDRVRIDGDLDSDEVTRQSADTRCHRQHDYDVELGCRRAVDADRAADGVGDCANSTQRDDGGDSRQDADAVEDGEARSSASAGRWLRQAARHRLLLHNSRPAEAVSLAPHPRLDSVREGMRDGCRGTRPSDAVRGKLALGQATVGSQTTNTTTAHTTATTDDDIDATANNTSTSTRNHHVMNDGVNGSAHTSSLSSCSLTRIAQCVSSHAHVGWWGCFAALDTWATFTSQPDFCEALQPLDRAAADGFYAAMTRCFALWRAQRRAVFITRGSLSHTRTPRRSSRTHPHRTGSHTRLTRGGEDAASAGSAARQVTIATTQQWYEATRVQRLMVQCLLTCALAPNSAIAVTSVATTVTGASSDEPLTLSIRLPCGAAVHVAVEKHMRQWRFECACEAAVTQAVRRVCGRDGGGSSQWVCYRKTRGGAHVSSAEETSSSAACASELLTLVPQRGLRSAESDAERDTETNYSSNCTNCDATISANGTHTGDNYHAHKGSRAQGIDTRSTRQDDPAATDTSARAVDVSATSSAWLRDAVCIRCHGTHAVHNCHRRDSENDCACQILSVSSEFDALPANIAAAVSLSSAQWLHVPTPLRLLLLLDIVDELWSLPAAQPFQLPVSEAWEAPGYYRVIRDPVCLDSLYDAIYHGTASHRWTTMAPATDALVAAADATSAKSTHGAPNTHRGTKHSVDASFIDYTTLRERIVLLKLNCERYNGLGTILAGDAATLLRVALKTMRCTQNTEKRLCANAQRTALAAGDLIAQSAASVHASHDSNGDETRAGRGVVDGVASSQRGVSSHARAARADGGDGAEWTRAWARSLSDLQTLFPVRERCVDGGVSSPSVAEGSGANLAEAGAASVSTKKSLSLSCAAAGTVAASSAATKTPITKATRVATAVKPAKHAAAKSDRGAVAVICPIAPTSGSGSHAVRQDSGTTRAATTTAAEAADSAVADAVPRTTHTLLDDEEWEAAVCDDDDSHARRHASSNHATHCTTTGPSTPRSSGDGAAPAALKMSDLSMAETDELPQRTTHNCADDGASNAHESRRRLRLGGSSAGPTCGALPRRREQARHVVSGALTTPGAAPTPKKRRSWPRQGGDEAVSWLRCDRCDSWRVVDAVPDPLPGYWECAYARQPCDAAKLMKKMQKNGSRASNNNTATTTTTTTATAAASTTTTEGVHPAAENGARQPRKRSRMTGQEKTSTRAHRGDAVVARRSGRAHGSDISSTNSNTRDSDSDNDASAVIDGSVSDDSSDSSHNNSSSSSSNRGRKGRRWARRERRRRKVHEQRNDAMCSSMLDQLEIIENVLDDVEAMPHNEKPLQLLEQLQKLKHRVYDV